MIDDLVKYYQNLLIIQYHDKQTAKSEIELATKTFTGDDLMSQIVFDVDTSEGAQLDLIGKIVGLSRIVEGFTFTNKYYSYDDYSEPMSDSKGHGMSDIDAPVEVAFKDYDESRKSIYSMTDGQYRKMIRLKILQNNSVATNEFIDNSLFAIFGSGFVAKDNEDMSIEIAVQPQYEFEARLAEYMGLLPKPIGVGLIVNYM